MKRLFLVAVIVILATSLCSGNSVPYTDATAQMTLRYYSVNPDKALQIYNEVISNYSDLDLEDLVDVIMNAVKAFDYTKEPLMGPVALMTRLVSYTGDDPALLVNRMSQLVASWTQLPIAPVAAVYYIVYKTQYMPSSVTAELLNIAPVIESIRILPEDVTFYSVLLLRKGLTLWPLGTVITCVINDAKRSGMSNSETLIELSRVFNTIGEPGIGSNVPALLATYGIPLSTSQQIINGFSWPMDYVLELRKEIGAWMGGNEYKTQYPYTLTLPMR